MLERAADSGDFVEAFLLPDSGAGDRLAVADRTADGGEEQTYGDLARNSRRAAAGLAARGVMQGQRVVLAGTPGSSWLAALLGILRRGAVAVPLDPGLAEAEMAPMVSASAPAAILGSDEMEALSVGEDRVAARADAVRGLDDVAMIVWTSGTAGAPKGVALTFANIAYSVGQAMVAQQPSSDDRWLSVLPAHHLLELCCGLLPALASGGSVCFAHTLMPQEIAGIIRERGITKMVAVPLVLRLLEPAVAGSGLQTAYCGGAPLDPAVVVRYAAQGIAVYQGYGLTEAAPTVAMNTPAHHRAGSVGRPLTGTEVRITRAPGAGAGEILVRSPGVMRGYWREDARSSGVVDADGWLHTGDLGFVDEDDFLFVTGREKRLVVLESGKKVQPEEVEAALAASDLFADVCVVGVVGVAGARRRLSPSEQVCAVVVPSPTMISRHGELGTLQEAVTAEVARRTSSLSGYKRPSVVKVHDGPFPRTRKGTPRHAEVARLVEKGYLN
ncbi:MAG: class I adenylate-forming enzyme family protein [Acidimicrobiales bacterium]